MEWLTAIRDGINFMEEHIYDCISAQDAARHVHISPVHFQRGFTVMTGYTPADYLRNRRLFLAALELRHSDVKIIDLALKYGYDNPESFTKAFVRFHGNTPMQVRSGADFKPFLPLKIRIQINGGNQMDCTIKSIPERNYIGFADTFNLDTAKTDIPKFWDRIQAQYFTDPVPEIVLKHGIGSYGICIDDADSTDASHFLYMVAGEYRGGDVPENMMVYTVPAGEWAVFECIGSLPDTLQKLNDRIFTEWLPGNPEYEISGNISIEWYSSKGSPEDSDYRSEIWVPVTRK